MIAPKINIARECTYEDVEYDEDYNYVYPEYDEGCKPMYPVQVYFPLEQRG